jgi:uncharacterized protein YebE (UPF0316 family)
MRNLNDFTNYIAYAGGFAAGTYVGMWLDDKLSLGTAMIRVVTSIDATDLIAHLKKKIMG